MNSKPQMKVFINRYMCRTIIKIKLYIYGKIGIRDGGETHP